MGDFIQLKNEDLVRIGIKDYKGNDTGEWLEFDMSDIELPLKLNKCEAEHKKNMNYVKMQFQVIEKKPDKKGKYLLSSNEEEKCNLLNEYYKRESEALDLFLGENGTKKMLAGRKPYWGMYDDISEALEPVLPKLKMSIDNVANKIKNKYKSNEDKNVLK